ncbi:hypothetical protein D3C81_1300710 [compost metagenome]
MAVAPGDLIAVAVAFADVRASGDAKRGSALAVAHCHTGIPAAGLVIVPLVTLLFCRHNINVVVGKEGGALFAADIGANDIDIRLFAAGCHHHRLFTGVNSACQRAGAVDLFRIGLLALAIGERHAHVLRHGLRAVRH